MTIQVGDTLPQGRFQRLRETVQTLTSEELFGNARVLLFAVPGAFTPTCSNRHLPGYVRHMEAFRSMGVTVACLSVNDAFVMAAWAKSQDVPDDLLMLADGNGEYVQALGLSMDGQAFGMGMRAKRFALYAENGVVTILHSEAPGEFGPSSAEAMLEALTHEAVLRNEPACD
jgi:peroxiredoxin